MQRTITGPERDWLSLEQAASYIGVSASTLERLIESGRFPQGVSVSAKKRVWGWLDIVAYMHLASRMQGEKAPEGEDD